MSTTATTYTFADSEVYSGILFYTYVLITFVIVGGAYYFAGKVQLFYESYQLLKSIENELGYTTLGIRAILEKEKMEKEISEKETLGLDGGKINNDKMETLDGITRKSVVKHVKSIFSKIRDLVDKHEMDMLKKVGINNDSIINNDDVASNEKRNENGGADSSQNEKQRMDENKDNVNDAGNHNDEIETNALIEHEYEAKADVSNEEDASLSDAKLKEYIDKEMDKRTMKNSKGFERFIKTMWEIRGLMVPSVAHFFDTATDVALVIEWYYLYKLQRNGINEIGNLDISDVNMTLLFYCSLFVLVYYRLSSTWNIFRLSSSWLDTILQFLFDFYLIKAIYVNIYKFRSHKPLSFIKIIRGFEGSTESAFQAILALVFLMKINVLDSTALLSLVASMYSLLSRFVYLDLQMIDPCAHNSNLESDDLCSMTKITRKFSTQWLEHVIFRSIDISVNTLTLALFWHYMGFVWVVGVWLATNLLHFVVRRRTLGLRFINFFLRQPFGWQNYSFIKLWHDRAKATKNKIKKAFYTMIHNVMFHGSSTAFMVARCICLAIIFIQITMFNSDDSNLNYTSLSVENKESALWLILWLCSFLSLIVLPLYFHTFITKIYLRETKDRSMLSSGFRISYAIRLGDIEFLTFAKLMNANIFRPAGYCKCDSGLAKIMTFLRKNQNKCSILEALTIDKFNVELYCFLKEWYNEIHHINGNDNSNEFEKYLASFMDAASAFFVIRRINGDEDNINEYPQMLDILKQNGINFAQYKGNGLTIRRRLDGWNLLHYAVRFNNSPIVIKWLLDNESFDINQVASRNQANGNKFPNIWHLLLRKIRRSNYPKLKIYSRDVAIAKLLVEHGIKLDKIDRSNMHDRDKQTHDSLVKMIQPSNNI